ncbi:MAG: TIGR01777 family oxidoreductase [Anaerolineae bacterium]|nr:TIGR01777 family oxidoreductase [Anaerolineae bacterium]
MRVIITGGTGLIGSKLANELARDEHEVIVLSRSPRTAKGLDSKVKVEGWDAKSAHGWGPLVNGTDAIINLAASNLAGNGFFPQRWTDERKARILQSRLDAGKAVLEAIEQAETKPKVLIQASAVGYYGARRANDEITEQAAAGNDFLADVCKQWEASTEDVERIGVRRPAIRTGVLLSKEGGALPRLALPFQMFVGGPMGSGKQPVPWIHMDDVISAIRFLMTHPTATGPFNLTAPNPVTNAEFGRKLGEAMGRPSLIPVPGFALKTAFGEVATVVLDGQWAVPARLLELGFTFKYPTVEEALAALYGRESTTVAH